MTHLKKLCNTVKEMQASAISMHQQELGKTTMRQMKISMGKVCFYDMLLQPYSFKSKGCFYSKTKSIDTVYKMINEIQN